MVVTIILGIVSSLFTELVTALNAKLKNTVLKGDAAFLLAFAVAFIFAAVKTILFTPGFVWNDWPTLATEFGAIFTVSQVYFILIMQKLNIDVATPSMVTMPANGTTGTVSSGDKV